MEHQKQRRRASQKNKPTIRRLLANKCERERVRKINEAFEILKTHIPYCDSGRIRTKLDVLKFAIDYIQILSKMVSQTDAAAILLNPTQMENTPEFMLSSDASEAESRRLSNELFPTALHEVSSLFPFDEQIQRGLTPPTLSSHDDEVFFDSRANLHKEEHVSGGQYHAWSDHQSGFHPQQTHQHNDHPPQTLAHSSFEDYQEHLPFWAHQGSSDMLKAVMHSEEPKTPAHENDDSELTAWLNL